MQSLIDSLWIWRFQARRIVDGDTIDCLVDHGFRHYSEQRVRLLGYNAPEARGYTRSWGEQAAIALGDLMAETMVGKESWGFIQSYKGDSFGRWLGNVWTSEGWDVVKTMIRAGYGVAWDGKGKNPTPWVDSGVYPLNPSEREKFQ